MNYRQSQWFSRLLHVEESFLRNNMGYFYKGRMLIEVSFRFFFSFSYVESVSSTNGSRRDQDSSIIAWLVRCGPWSITVCSSIVAQSHRKTGRPEDRFRLLCQCRGSHQLSFCRFCMLMYSNSDTGRYGRVYRACRDADMQRCRDTVYQCIMYSMGRLYRWVGWQVNYAVYPS